MVMALMGCFGVLGPERKVAPASKQQQIQAGGERGEAEEAKQLQQRGVAGNEKKQQQQQLTGDEAIVVEAARKEVKKSGAPHIVVHHFPFHSRPGLL